MTLAGELSHYAYSLKYNDIPKNIVYESKKRIIDALGCGIGAFSAEPVKFSRKIAERAKVNYGSTLLGTEKASTPDMAAFVNGIMVRYFAIPTYPKSPRIPATTSAPASLLPTRKVRMEKTSCYQSL